MTTPSEGPITVDAAALAEFIGSPSADAILQAAWQGIVEAKVLRLSDGNPFLPAITSVAHGEATVRLGAEGIATWNDLHPFKVSVSETLASTLAAMFNSRPQSVFHWPIRPWSRN